MVGELCKTPRPLLPREALEGLTGPSMQDDAESRGDGFVEHIPDQRMREPEPTGDAGYLTDHTRP